jgi:hypothetical protein
MISRLAPVAALVLGVGVGSAVGCGRASEAKCRQAVHNIFAITGIDRQGGTGPDEHAAIRSCRANASAAAVDCMIAAKTVADLAGCEGETAADLLELGGGAETPAPAPAPGTPPPPPPAPAPEPGAAVPAPGTQ